MTTERIDHIGEARRLQEVARGIISDQPTAFAPHMGAVILLDEARLEAQLAIAEQLRLANLISMAKWNSRALTDGARRVGGGPLDLDAEYARIDAIFAEVQKGMGR